jgi:hypothetical protein
MSDMLIYNTPKDFMISTLNAENKQKNKFLPAYSSHYIRYSSGMFKWIAASLKCSNQELSGLKDSK